MTRIMVKKEMWAVVAALVVGLLIGLAPCEQSAWAVDFSADQVTVDANGKIIAEGKIYMSSKGARMEYAAPEGKGDMISIFRKDKKLMWMVNPAAKKYMEEAFDENKMKEAFKMTVGRTVKVLGTEKVQGFKCTKKSVETTTTFLGIKNTSESTIWESDRFGMPLKTQTKDGTVSELRNIKIGKQPGKLFEVPAGYTKVSNIIALFGDGQEGSGSGKEGEQGSFTDIQKNISDKFKNFKWPFGGDKSGETAK
ncbi:MAG: DUF4412 domain-containing protein [Deltaproteobacteria bacterium]|nr:DUF4412 domain-containing protein [Deltaproteobacteria bacterium]MBN2686700.1 DUF4412 domain-containing protein [Deltaproteobacteria bacterium]